MVTHSQTHLSGWARIRSAASTGQRCRWDLLVRRTAEEFNVTEADLLGRRKPRHLVMARQCLCHLAVSMTGLAYEEIARGFGQYRAQDARHHSAVGYGAHQWLRDCEHTPALEARAERIRAAVSMAEDDAAPALVAERWRADLRLRLGPPCRRPLPDCPRCRAWFGLEAAIEQLMEGKR